MTGRINFFHTFGQRNQTFNMEASELRLRNIILNNGVLSIVELIEENGCKIRQIEKGDPDYDRGMEGAPLTEERLIKFGYIKNREIKNNYLISKVKRNDVIYSSHDYDFQAEDDEEIYIEIRVSKDPITNNIRNIRILGIEKFFAECDYIHQFQNLHLILTGEELKWNI